MKQTLLLAAILMNLVVVRTYSQNVFDPNDPIVRYSSSAAYGTTQKPDTTKAGLQKWVSVSTNGVSTGGGSFNASSFKAYFMNHANAKLAFRLKFPRSYADSAGTGKKYPVFLFLHGAGEVACASNGGIYNNEKQLVLGGRVFMNRADNGQLDGILLYPQLLGGNNCWGEWGGSLNGNYNTIITIIDSLVKYVNADIDRVFAFGLSGGAIASWRIADFFPTRIASIAPTSAAQIPVNYANMIHIPIWLATGGRDSNPSPAMAEWSETKVRELGGYIRRELYPDLGHASWDRHWAEPDFVPFMNEAHKANPLVFFQRNEFCPETPVDVKLGITAGFHSYEWERDGVLIARRINTTNSNVNTTHVSSFTGNEVTVKSYGTYRVRFRRTATGPWSEWSPKPAVISPKAITQTPPIQVTGLRSRVLPSPDGNTTVPLQLPQNFQNYQWVRATDGVVVSTNHFYEAPVGVYRARYTEPFGCGTEYSPDFRVASSNGSPKPDGAKNLVVAPLSQTVLQLDWSDNPNAATNETNFEIYRATQAGGPYTLVGITGPDVATFRDTTLTPNTRYYYVVRSVAEMGAGPLSSEVNAKTELDNQAPTAPANLEYRGATSTTVSLRWTAATDNIGIDRYDIYVDGTKLYSTSNTFFTVANLDSLTSYTFTVKAIDKAGNVSPNSNQLVAYTHRQGLTYKYYHGTYNNLPNFNNLTPVKTGITDTVNTGENLRERADNYAFFWESRIYIPVSGRYTFETESDDGSKLYINTTYSVGATALVNNDGAHGAQVRAGSINLNKGYHSIIITYAEVGGDETMNVYWSNNVGLSRERIPKGFFALEDNAGVTTLTAPSSLVAVAADYNKIDLSWQDNSANETGFEIVRSTSMTGTFTPIHTTAAGVTSYTDSGLNAGTKYFYKIRAVNSEGESSYSFAFTEANWRFNNNYSDSEGGTALSPSSTTFTTSNPAEGSHAVEFNSSDYISMGNGNAFPAIGGYNQRTIGVWIRPGATNNKRMIWEIGGSSDGIGLRFNSNALQAAITSGGTANIATASLSNFTSNANWVSGQWNYVAVVYDVNQLRLHLNGALVATANVSFGSMATSNNPSRMGNRSGSSNAHSVFNDGSYTAYAGFMDNMHIIRGALSQAEINQIRANSFQSSVATTLSAPAAPAAPSGLVGTALSTSRVQLTWNDNSSSETGFEIWRASGDKSNNRRIATIPGGSGAEKTFTDTGLFANTAYYYRVRAVGTYGTSAYTSEVTVQTLNSKPQIKNIRDFTMRYGTTFSLPVTATDEDGDVLSFTFSGLPGFATVQHTGNGTMNIVFTPTLLQRGTYPISIYVADTHNGKDTVFFRLAVNTNDVPVMSTVPATLTLSEGEQLSLPVSATDNNGTAKMFWTFEGLPSFANFTNNNNGSGVINFQPGYDASGVYEVLIIVNDGYDAWTSRTVMLTVQEKDPEETLQFNFRGQSATVVGWNNVNIAAPSFSHGTIANTKGDVSPVSVTLLNGGVELSTQGPQAPNESGVYPNLVMRDLMRWGWNQGNNNLDTLTVRVAGLNPANTYNFVFYSGYNLFGDANSVTTFRIGTQTAAVNYFGNYSMTDTIYHVIPNGSGEVLVYMMGDPNTTRGGMLNAMVIQSNFDDGSAPSKPLNFTGQHVPSKGVQLTWEDRAYNEMGYRVYRSLTRNGDYTVLNDGDLNKDSISYLDATASASSTYYYYVAGFNGSGIGASSDTVKVVTGNNSPVIQSIADIYEKNDAVRNIDFTVTDDPSDAVTVSLENKPSFVTLQHTGGANYRLVIAPNADHIGWYTLRIRAVDNHSAASTSEVKLSVMDKNTRSVFVKFGRAGRTAPAPWNNWLGFRGANNSITNLRDENNNNTTFGVRTVSAWNFLSELGHVTGNNSGVYPDSVLQSSITDNTAGARVIEITGLDNSKRYNLVFVASQNEGLPAVAEYYSGTQRDTLDARYNTQRTANLNGLVPSGGTITANVQRLAGSAIAYLNALIIEEYDPSLTILGPNHLYADPIDRTTVEITWSDRASNEAALNGYVLERASDSLFTLNLVSVELPANTSSYRDVSVTPNTRYWYRVRARTSGGVFSAYSNRKRVITPASIVSVSFNYTMPDAAFPWNNFYSNPSVEYTLPNLINQTGVNSGLSLTLTRIFNGEFTAGVNTGNNSGVVPDNALASNFWLDKTQLSQFRLSGLNHSRKYRIGFFGSSSSNGWFKGDYTATYTINGRTVYLNSWENRTKVVYIDNVVPNQNGEVLLDFSTTEAAAYGFNGGVIIQDYTDPDAASGSGGTQQFSVLADDVDGAGTAAGDGNSALLERLATTAAGKMYPNPFTDIINLDFNNASADNNISVEVYDLAGRMNYRRIFGKLSAGASTLRISAADAKLSSGVYIITLSVDGKPVQANKVVRTNN